MKLRKVADIGIPTEAWEYAGKKLCREKDEADISNEDDMEKRQDSGKLEEKK